MATTKTLSHADRLERRKAMAEAVKGGKTPGEVARLFSVSIWTVKGACQEAGVPVSSASTAD